MKEVEQKEREVKELILWLEDLSIYYDNHNKCKSSLTLRSKNPIIDDEKNRIKDVENQILNIKTNVKGLYNEYSRSNTINIGRLFNEKTKIQNLSRMLEEVYKEVCKLIEINILKDLDDVIADKVVTLRLNWGVVDIPTSNLKINFSEDPLGAIAEVEAENLRLKLIFEANKKQLEEADKCGYLYLPNANLLVAPKADNE